MLKIDLKTPKKLLFSFKIFEFRLISSLKIVFVIMERDFLLKISKNVIFNQKTLKLGIEKTVFEPK